MAFKGSFVQIFTSGKWTWSVFMFASPPCQLHTRHACWCQMATALFVFDQ